jgi:ribosomal protein S18 acetylase RimI-like enzyme
LTAGRLSAATATLDPRLAALFRRVWPALPDAAERAASLGFAWSAVSRPFVRWENGRAVGHVGVIEVPLVLDGRVHLVGSIHAVCTDPDWRGRGIGSALMREALRACAGRYATVVLTTAIPDFYTPFGFRPVPEHAFVGPLRSTRRARGPAARPLTLAAEDLQLLHRVLTRRAPESRRLGSLEDGTVFVVGMLLTWGDLSRARHVPALDVVVVYEVVGRTLVLYHVLGETIPPLAALAAEIAGDADRVIALVAPDQLDAALDPEPWDAARAASIGAVEFAGLMARGPLDVTGPFMLPTLSRT